MEKQKRYRIEMWSSSIGYGYNCRITCDYEEIKSGISSSRFGELLESTDKRLYSQYIDGNTIFELTERQYNKLLKLLQAENQ